MAVRPVLRASRCSELYLLHTDLLALCHTAEQHILVVQRWRYLSCGIGIYNASQQATEAAVPII